MTNSKQLIGQIASEYLSIPTLEPRKSDSLDFHQVSVWAVEAALNAAFEAGSQYEPGQRRMIAQFDQPNDADDVGGKEA